jgi:hypothetical protein
MATKNKKHSASCCHGCTSRAFQKLGVPPSSSPTRFPRPSAPTPRVLLARPCIPLLLVQVLLPAFAKAAQRAAKSVMGVAQRLPLALGCTAPALPHSPSRRFHAAPAALDSEAFKEAVARVRAANTDNATLLNLYALFKQATVGPNDTPKPSMLDFVVSAAGGAAGAPRNRARASTTVTHMTVCFHVRACGDLHAAGSVGMA